MQIRILKSAQNSRFVKTQYGLFQEKKFSPLRRAIFQILGQNNPNQGRNRSKYRKLPFLKYS
jgi:hypothetical protein